MPAHSEWRLMHVEGAYHNCGINWHYEILNCRYWTNLVQILYLSLDFNVTKAGILPAALHIFIILHFSTKFRRNINSTGAAFGRPAWN